MSDRKDHLGRNDRKDSHYNLIQCGGSADLDLMLIRVFNRIVHNQENTMPKIPCCRTPLKLVRTSRVTTETILPGKFLGTRTTNWASP